MKSLISRHHGASQAGFTLVELLVAMSITSVITIALLSLVGNTTDSYTRTHRAVNSLSQARSFIHFFEAEIGSRLPGSYFLLRTSDTFSGPETSDKLAFIRVLSPEIQDAFENPPNPADSDPGDLGSVAYYADFLPGVGNSSIPALFRKELGPTDTQAILEAGSNASLPDLDPESDEPLVLNLLEFGTQPKIHNPTTGALEDWDPESTDDPVALEVTIRFVDDSTAQRFKTESEWNRLATNPSEQEKPLIRSYTRIFPLAQ